MKLELNNYLCVGAIIGDIIGSPYEYGKGKKTEDFPLFTSKSKFTDDTVLTVAVAAALTEAYGNDKEYTRMSLIYNMINLCKLFGKAGYGARFVHWLNDPVPYNSYGNGSAMRVSPVGWLYDTLEETLSYARLTAEVSHNHPEGIKGAEATAASIFLTRQGMEKKELKKFITDRFGYDLSRTLDEIRPGYRHVESCQETVPEAITAYMEGNSFEDVVRKAVSLGGDCDTLTAIAASIAEAKYKIPDEIKMRAISRLPDILLDYLYDFEERLIMKYPNFYIHNN